MNADALLDMIMQEYESLPPIDRLDEYQHFETQLKLMRKRSLAGHNTARFAMELGVFLRLSEYCKKIGVPDPRMPSGHDAEDDRIVLPF